MCNEGSRYIEEEEEEDVSKYSLCRERFLITSRVHHDDKRRFSDEQMRMTEPVEVIPIL